MIGPEHSEDTPGSAAPSSDAASDHMSEILADATAVEDIPVHVSYEIIRLFSEGLYQSPQKAVEELVSNSYDANATGVHVLLPPSEAEEEATPPLWVIDDGHGLDTAGFTQLWRVADSVKAEATVEDDDRAPIGQFGIGKLAAYVLVWKLTHVSSVDGVIKATSMNFRRLQGRHQYNDNDPSTSSCSSSPPLKLERYSLMSRKGTLKRGP